jgi:polyferredoxin
MNDAAHETWINNRWRPAMGWMYLVVCVFDFVIFPVAWAMLKSVLGEPVTAWEPLTLQGAGLFHISMGAVLGITAWGRSKEKMCGVAGDRD